MAETAKILNPDKRVFLPNPQAGCPMAEQFSPDEICRMKESEPERAVVAYINTTAEIKKLCDVCVTSSSAVKIVKAMQADKILFIPDCNLGEYIKSQVDKDIMLVEGGCPVHAAVTIDDVSEARSLYTDALLLVHPECSPDVVKAADYVGSTTGIIEFAGQSAQESFIIGTEMSIREHLQYDNPGKKFYPLSKKISCPDMRITTLLDVYNLLSIIEKAGNSGDLKHNEIIMSDDDITQAGRCIDEMLRLGG